MSEDREQSSPSWHKHRWLIVLGIFFAVLSMVVVGISVATYLAWQASPEKALLDAVEYSSKTPAEYRIVTDDFTVSVSYDGEHSAITGTYDSVKFNAIVDGSIIYIKSSTPKELVALFAPKEIVEKYQPTVDAIASRITDRWVSMSLDRVPLGNDSDASSISCWISANAQLTTNKQAKKELASLYTNNRFLAIDKTAVTDKSNKFTVKIDHAKLDEFMTNLKKSDFYGSLKSQCADTVQRLADMAQKHTDAAAEILLSKSKNALQKLTLGGVSDQPYSITARYGDVGKIVVPTDAITYESISNSILQTMVWSYLNNR
jgi:hypothetical protein